MKFIIAGGGTGGHVYPALAVADALKKKYPECNVLFVGSARGLEAAIIPSRGYPIKFIHARGLSRKPIEALSASLHLSLGCLEALTILLKEKPDLVLGAGGFVSAPTVFMAGLLGKKIFLLEQNVTPGKTTKFLSRWAKTIFTSFPETEKYLPPGKSFCTGNPVREEMFTATREEGLRKFNLRGDKFTLLVTGASQGAKSINDAVLAALQIFRDENWQILHLTGKGAFQEIREKSEGILPGAIIDYRCIDYTEDIAYAYAASDLVLCRAGATTVAEIAAAGKPAILVPYPYAAEGHQEKNARYLEDAGAGVMIPNKEIGEKLAQAVKEMADSPEKLKGMAANSKKLGRPDALEKIIGKIAEGMAG